MATACDSESKIPSKVRVAVMGADGVGKTCILSRLLYGRFPPVYHPTMEEFHHPVWKLADGREITMDVIDSSGSNTFPALRGLAMAYADAFVLVFSLDDKQSFTNLRDLRKEIMGYKDDTRVPIVIVANKDDLEAEHKDDLFATASALATEKWQNGFVKTSAKDNNNVQEMFHELFRQLESPSSGSTVRR